MRILNYFRVKFRHWCRDAWGDTGRRGRDAAPPQAPLDSRRKSKHTMEVRFRCVHFKAKRVWGAGLGIERQRSQSEETHEEGTSPVSAWPLITLTLFGPDFKRHPNWAVTRKVKSPAGAEVGRGSFRGRGAVGEWAACTQLGAEGHPQRGGRPTARQHHPKEQAGRNKTLQ